MSVAKYTAYTESADSFLQCHLRTSVEDRLPSSKLLLFFCSAFSKKEVIRFGFPARDFFSKQKTSTCMRVCVYFIFRARMLSALLFLKKS